MPCLNLNFPKLPEEIKERLSGFMMRVAAHPGVALNIPDDISTQIMAASGSGVREEIMEIRSKEHRLPW